MPNSKIQILLSLVESFDKSQEKSMAQKALSDNLSTMGLLLNIKILSKEEIVSEIIPHFATKTTDKIWYQDIADSFKKAMIAGDNPHDWLAVQFKQLGIYQASDSLQGKADPHYHCMNFLLDALHSKQPMASANQLSNVNISFSSRMKSYLASYEAKPISAEQLTTGDLVIYSSKPTNKLDGKQRESEKDFIHVAIFIAKANDTDYYAISKFGLAHRVFIHRIQDVCDAYEQQPKFYKTQLKLTQEVTAKLEGIKKELYSNLLPTPAKTSRPVKYIIQTDINSYGAKLRSGNICWWPLGPVINGKHYPLTFDVVRPNTVFRPV